MRTALIALGIFLMGSLIGNEVGAVDDKFVSLFESESAQKALDQGQVNSALNRSLKALVFDPFNPSARGILRALQKKETVPENQSRLLKTIADLLEVSAGTFEEYDRLARANIRRLRALLQRSEDMDSLVDFRDWLTVVIETAPPSFKSQVLLPDVLPSEGPRLDVFYEHLKKYQKQIEFALVRNQQIQSDVEAAANREDESVRDSDSDIQGLIQDQLSRLEHAGPEDPVGEAGDGGIAPEDEVRHLREQVFQMQNQMMQILKLLRENTARVEDLTRQVAGLSLEVYEKNQALAQKEQRIQQLESQITETARRFELLRRLLEERDERIARLQADREKDVLNDRSSAELSPRMENRLDWAAFFPSGAWNVLLFRSQREVWRRDVERLFSAAQQWAQEYRSLERRLTKVQMQLTTTRLRKNQFRHWLSLKELESQRREQMIQIYQEKLAEALKALREREKFDLAPARMDRVKKESLQGGHGEDIQRRTLFPLSPGALTFYEAGERSEPKDFWDAALRSLIGVPWVRSSMNERSVDLKAAAFRNESSGIYGIR